MADTENNHRQPQQDRRRSGRFRVTPICSGILVLELIVFSGILVCLGTNGWVRVEDHTTQFDIGLFDYKVLDCNCSSSVPSICWASVNCTTYTNSTVGDLCDDLSSKIVGMHVTCSHLKTGAQGAAGSLFVCLLICIASFALTVLNSRKPSRKAPQQASTITQQHSQPVPAPLVRNSNGVRNKWISFFLIALLFSCTAFEIVALALGNSKLLGAIEKTSTDSASVEIAYSYGMLIFIFVVTVLISFLAVVWVRMDKQVDNPQQQQNADVDMREEPAVPSVDVPHEGDGDSSSTASNVESSSPQLNVDAATRPLCPYEHMCAFINEASHVAHYSHPCVNAPCHDYTIQHRRDFYHGGIVVQPPEHPEGTQIQNPITANVRRPLALPPASPPQSPSRALVVVPAPPQRSDFRHPTSAVVGRDESHSDHQLVVYEDRDVSTSRGASSYLVRATPTPSPPMLDGRHALVVSPHLDQNHVF
eukprot:PhM_4_TR14383/c0_g2_i1/m.60965